MNINITQESISQAIFIDWRNALTEERTDIWLNVGLRLQGMWSMANYAEGDGSGELMDDLVFLKELAWTHAFEC